jgi:tRNA (mo5U34)-methyltransferase
MEDGLNERENLAARVAALHWYHTIDLGGGVVTPGFYDHRPYLAHYSLPDDLSGKTALDVGAASGFFSFELERRGARVTAIDLPAWHAHDFSPIYQPEQSLEAADAYLHQPFELARRALGSSVERRLVSIYDLSPESVGSFDLVFCGSLLIHLTDPIRALWKIAGVTRERAIIATVITRTLQEQPIAQMTGYPRGDTWWAPTRRCLELMAASAGFAGIEWIGEFTLDRSDGTPGPLHGVLHAWKSTAGWGPNVIPATELSRESLSDLRDPEVVWLRSLIAERDREIGWLRDLVRGYERGWYIRVMRYLRGFPHPPPPISDVWDRD